MVTETVWIAQMTNCGDYYCEGDHILGIYRSEQQAQDRIANYKSSWSEHVTRVQEFSTHQFRIGDDW